MRALIFSRKDASRSLGRTQIFNSTDYDTYNKQPKASNGTVLFIVIKN
jgi:hypothetical protein